MAVEIIDVDPRILHVPPSRSSGADPFKLHQQIAHHGASTFNMPRIWAYRGSDDELMITDGVTRATRIAKLAPGTMVTIEVIGILPSPVGHLPKIGDLLP